MHKITKQLIFYSYLALVFYLTLMPGSQLKSIDKAGFAELLDFDHSDKLVHAAMFFGLSFLFQWLKVRSIAQYFFIPVSISFLIEILQGIMPFGRTFDWFDLWANSIGILLAIGLFQSIKKAKS